MNNLSHFQPDWISAPGETISDLLEERDIPLNSFAKQMDLSHDFIDSLLIGKEPISSEIALKLERILGSTARFWLSRERTYQDKLSELENVEKEEWIKSLPIKDMFQYGWIKKTRNIENELYNFFNIKNFNEWQNQYNQIVDATRFRTSRAFKSKLISTVVWLKQGEIQANEMNCKEWNPVLFEEKLIEIKRLSRIKKPVDFLPQLQKLCAECGVALTIVRTPSGCRASGATKFLTDKKALLQLSFRYLSDDQFWFSFFHEAGHLLLHNNKKLFIEEVNWNDIDDPEENDANFFAGEMLIPSELHSELRVLPRNKRQIVSFAQKAGVSPGIVIGQMQHYGIIKPNYLNSYKRRYKWDEIITIQSSR